MIELILVIPYYIIRFLLWFYLMLTIMIISLLTLKSPSEEGFEMFKKHTHNFNQWFN